MTSASVKQKEERSPADVGTTMVVSPVMRSTLCTTGRAGRVWGWIAVSDMNKKRI